MRGLRGERRWALLPHIYLRNIYDTSAEAPAGLSIILRGYYVEQLSEDECHIQAAWLFVMRRHPRQIVHVGTQGAWEILIS